MIYYFFIAALVINAFCIFKVLKINKELLSASDEMLKIIFTQKKEIVDLQNKKITKGVNENGYM